MKNPFKEKPPPPKPPTVLTVDQITALLTLHSYAGGRQSKGNMTVFCGCGKELIGGFRELQRHAAEEIAALQK